MRRRAYMAGALVLVLVATAYAFAPAQAPIGPDVRLALFETGVIHQGLLYVLPTKTIPDVKVSVRIDSDGSGEFTDTELAVTGMLIPVHAGQLIGIPVTLASIPREGARVELNFAGQKIERRITQMAVEETDVIQSKKVTLPLSAIKAGSSISFEGTAPQSASRPVLMSRAEILPDSSQGVAECAPVVFATNMYAIARSHDKVDTLMSLDAIVVQLKTSMRWTAKNGVLSENFLAGANAWTKKHNLPIVTRRVGDLHGHGALKAIDQALHSGTVVGAEIRLQLIAQNDSPDGGHMITIREIRLSGSDTYIDVYDPRTPEGLDTYLVRNGIVVGYPYNGLAFVSWGFIQEWTDSSGA